MRFATTSAIVLALLAPLPVRAQLTVTPAVSWSGKKFVYEEDGGGERLLTNQAEFDSLWMGWRKAEKVPVIDFSNYFVVVSAYSFDGDPFAITGLKVNAKGNATPEFTAWTYPLMGDWPRRPKGFGYTIDLFPRANVKTYRGKAITGS